MRYVFKGNASSAIITWHILRSSEICGVSGTFKEENLPCSFKLFLDE